jgi:hypothetical protein
MPQRAKKSSSASSRKNNRSSAKKKAIQIGVELIDLLSALAVSIRNQKKGTHMSEERDLTKDQALQLVKALENIRVRHKKQDQSVHKEIRPTRNRVIEAELDSFDIDLDVWLNEDLTKAEGLRYVKGLPNIKDRLKKKDKGAEQEVAVIKAWVKAGERQAFQDELDAWVNA